MILEVKVVHYGEKVTEWEHEGNFRKAGLVFRQGGVRLFPEIDAHYMVYLNCEIKMFIGYCSIKLVFKIKFIKNVTAFLKLHALFHVWLS